MIYLKRKSEEKEKFENLLLQTKNNVLSELSSLDNLSSVMGVEFEALVYNQAVLCSRGTDFEGQLRHTDDREFPDIVAAGFFGLEVKVTKKDDWTSIGNSVLESSRALTVEKIYLFFGKLGGSPDIIYRKYEECLKGIAVTHYPRYQIDMRLDDSNSIFKKIGTTYDELRNAKNPVRLVREYYKSQLKPGQSLWWIDDNLDDSTAPSPIIKSYSSLSRSEKDHILAEAMVIFPEIFSPSTKKYQSLAAYLASSYGIVSPSLRDEFSAGGIYEIKHDNRIIKFPHVVGEMVRLANNISSFLSVQTEESLSNFWRKKLVNFQNPLNAWLNEIDHQSDAAQLEIKLSDIFSGKN